MAPPPPAGGRIGLTDTPATAVVRLARGDIGAAEACIAMVKAVAAIDPGAAFGPFTPLVMLDRLDMTGPLIGLFYRRLCSGDPAAALDLLHALRLGLLKKDTLYRLCALPEAAWQARAGRLDLGRLRRLAAGRKDQPWVLP